MKNKKVKFIPCSEFQQVYSWNGRTNKKSNYVPQHMLDKYRKKRK
jgi:hypothetical protein